MTKYLCYVGKKTTMCVLLAVVSLIGCSSKLARPEVDLSSLGLRPGMLSDVEMEQALATTAEFEVPFGLAVARVLTTADTNRPFDAVPRVLAIDDDTRVAWAQTLAGTRGVHKVAFLEQSPSLRGARNDIVALRGSAGALGASLLLVYTTHTESVDTANAHALYYPTVVGLWTVKGNDVEVATTASAVLVDVRRGSVYAHFQAEARGSAQCAAVEIDKLKDSLRSATENEAVTSLREAAPAVFERAISRLNSRPLEQ